ncbi:5'-methylthioadenosine nucleosidase [Streptococcus equi subsp. zooepidemicus]|nr:5'-methylthioadenosine nucleosidase [Streptococcus equi subsp. zooepidemicus]
MKIGIIAAMEEELRFLLEQLQDSQEHQLLSNTYYTGRLGRHELILVQSGVGKVMSAMTVAMLAEHFQADAIINTGSAGAIASGLAIGDVVVADRLVYHDVDVTAFGYDYGQMAAQPLYFDSDSKLVETFKQVLDQEKTNSRIGLIATGDSFIAGQDSIDTIKAHFPETLAVEMEGAAVAQAAHAAGKPFIVVRAMSDTAAHDANMTFDQFIVEAGKKSAKVLIAFLEALPDKKMMTKKT